MNHRLYFAALAGVAHLAIVTPVAAQEAADTTAGPADNDIVVTATKSGAQSLQKTPLAIQAFSGDALKEKNVDDVGALIGSIPGASIAQETSAGIKSFNIRGVGVGGTNGDTPIGYYLDEVPFVVTNFGIAPPIRFLDLARVEVLRGPQGTLYGQGSAGGTMIFHTRDPDLDSVEVLGEAFGSSTSGASQLNWGLSGAVSIPLVKDVLAIRASGGISRQQGYADVYFGANDGTPDDTNVNRQKNSDWRVAVLFTPASNISIKGQIWQFRPTQKFTSLYSGVDPYTFEQTNGIEGSSRAKFTLYSLVGDMDLGGVAVTSATSYFKGAFATRTPLGPFGFGGGALFDSIFHPDNFNQELRVHSTGSGPLHWIAGANYGKGEGPQRNILDFVAFQLDTSNNAKTENWAGFGEVSYDLLGGKIVPLVGIRHYRDRRVYEEGAVRLPTTLKKTTYRINLSYLPNDDLTAFVTLSTGFRVNTIQSQLQAQLLQADGLPGALLLDPLSLKNYEAGLKARLFDGALKLGANVYHIEYSGIQSGYTTSAGIGGFVNLGDAHSTGVDIDVNWQTPLTGLVISAVGNYNSSKYDRVDPLVTAQFPRVREGGRLVSSAKYNYRLEANYARELSGETEIFTNVNFSRTGNRPTIAGVVAPAYELFGATLGVRRGPYEIAIFGDNLTDNRGPTDFFLPTIFSGLTPRTIGIRLRKSY